VIKIVVSACLLGSPVRHDGRDKKSFHPALQRWIDEGRVVSVCPEMLGGLGTPRPPSEIVADGSRRVMTSGGRDVTVAFQQGASAAVAEADAHGVRVAILKEASPSCGSSFIYDGTFTSHRLPGEGITAEALRKRGIAVFSDEQIDAAAEYIATLESER
jgi:uncharacterized protein YbbK (DUF523 family)